MEGLGARGVTERGILKGTIHMVWTQKGYLSEVVVVVVLMMVKLGWIRTVQWGGRLTVVGGEEKTRAWVEIMVLWAILLCGLWSFIPAYQYIPVGRGQVGEYIRQGPKLYGYVGPPSLT